MRESIPGREERIITDHRRVPARLLEIAAAQPIRLPHQRLEVKVLVEFDILEHELEDVATLLRVRQPDREPFRHPAQDRRVDVVRAVRRAEDEDPRVVRGGQTVPQRHELGFPVKMGREHARDQ